MPVATVLACSCGFAGYPEVIQAADFAFVGTVVEADEPDEPVGFQEAAYTFRVQRAKAPMDSPFTIFSTYGNDANCGFDMDIGQEWLVIVQVHEGRPTTNLCTGSNPVGGLDAPTFEHVAAVLTEEPPDTVESNAPEPDAIESGAVESADPNESAAPRGVAFGLSPPLLLLIGAAVIAGGIALLFIRRGGTG